MTGIYKVEGVGMNRANYHYLLGGLVSDISKTHTLSFC